MLPIPRKFDRSLLQSLSQAPARVLMLDYDGTLAPFREDRMAAVPYPGIRDAIERLVCAHHTHVAIVSGRPVSEIETLFSPSPHIDIWGAHGWERRRPQQETEFWTIPDSILNVLERAAEAVRDLLPAGSLEVKHGACVVHTRASSPSERTRITDEVQRIWRPFAQDEDIRLCEFDGGVELRVITRTKATAVATLRAEHPEGTKMAYLGDDRTDEDAFATISDQDLSILVRSSPHPTSARYWLAPPVELIRFIGDWTSNAERGTLGQSH